MTIHHPEARCPVCHAIMQLHQTDPALLHVVARLGAAQVGLTDDMDVRQIQLPLILPVHAEARHA